MTVLDDRQLVDWSAGCPRPVSTAARTRGNGRSGRAYRPVQARPVVAPLRYRGSGVPMSQAPHLRRPVSTAATVVLAAAAALITLWLGSLAQSGGDRSIAPAQTPGRLAVVQVQAGETLQHLAGRVAPDSPAGQVVERIRDLNDLDSVAVAAGQTLIAPVG